MAVLLGGVSFQLAIPAPQAGSLRHLPKPPIFLSPIFLSCRLPADFSAIPPGAAALHRPRSDGPTGDLDFSVQSHLVILVGDLVLVFEQPVDGGFAGHRFVDRLGHGLAMDVKQSFVVQLVRGRDTGVQPDAADDPQVIAFLFGDVAGTHRVQNAVGDRSLHRPHQNIGVAIVLDGDFADAQRDRANLDIRIQDGKDLGVPLGLIAGEGCQRGSHRAIQFADDDFGFRGGKGWSAGDE